MDINILSATEVPLFAKNVTFFLNLIFIRIKNTTSERNVKMFRNLFNKKNKRVIQDNTPATTANTAEKDINDYIKDITDLLGIECPHIQSVACIFETNEQIMAQREFRRSELPKDAHYHAAYYFDDRNLIILPRKFPVADIETQTLHFKTVKDAENLYSVAHELRHVWQKKYHPDIYYKHNAIGMEVINDIAEIDADAFAIAFIFSDRTSYTEADMPNALGDVCLQAKADGGKRWKRAYEIAEEFGFKNTEKIDAAKNSADYEEIERLIALMKQGGMI